MNHGKTATRRAFLKRSALAGAPSAFVPGFLSGVEAALSAFSTGGHTVYHLRPATIAGGGERAIVSASFDGFLLCHTPDGKLLWKASLGGGMPFDLTVADIDGDGLDEALVASADGCLYAIGHDGRPLWTFSKTAPLFQVSAARLPGVGMRILTGGVEQVLYELSAKGEIIDTLITPNCIRHVRSGNVLGDGRDYTAVATTSSGLNGLLSLMLIDPDGMKTLWRQSNLGSFASDSGKRFFSMLLLDLNHDGKQEIMLSNSWGEHGKIYAFDHTGKQVFGASDNRIPNVPYRMNLLEHVKLADDEYVLGLFANILIVYNLDGTCRQVITSRYDFSNAAFDRITRTYYVGSSPSGGDGIYALHLDRPSWQAAFESIRPTGQLTEIERNVRDLERQIAAFQPPPYQPAPRVITAIAVGPDGRKYRNVRFVQQITLAQKFERCEEVWCRETDRRQSYSMTADEIVAAARDKEAAGEDFLIFAGHGLATFMPLATMERVLQAAPRHFYGFLFAEMQGVDHRMREVVETIISPLAGLCKRYGGKKIVFHNKNIFYTGPIYVAFWRKALMDASLREVFVPALEETNSRTQELSLAGRIGLWLTGNFNRWACRVVTDDACFDRMWEWASQQVMTLHLRHLIAHAALGADVFFIDVYQGPFSHDLDRQFQPFYDMLETGILHVPERAELLSVSSLALGMKSPPSELYLRHGINGHGYYYSRDDHSPLVFDRLDAYWGAAPLLPHDFSYYMMNVRRRTPNFLPETPHGLVSIIPDDTPLRGTRFDRKITTDGRYFYDGSARHDPAEYKPEVEKAAWEHAARLPVRVRGNVHWSAVRLDANHIRVTLVDPGYLDPADREATVIAQGLQTTRCTDVLRRENLKLLNNAVRVKVPMGTIRVLDIAHR